jgi:phosphoglycerate dehydrogenase-like enzyme
VRARPSRTVLLPAIARGALEGRLPAGVEARWFAGPAEALAGVAEAEIAWIDLPRPELDEAVRRATALRWLFTVGAGVDYLDLKLLAERGVTLTNGSGLTAVAVAEYAVLGMLAAAKRYDEVVRLVDRRQWTEAAPGRRELAGSRALIVGFGEIGRRIAERLEAFDVEVTGVTRSGRDGTLRPDAWRARLGEFDWVVLATPATDATRAMIAAPELAAMRADAWLVNVGRGDLVDQEALVAALREHRIGGAFLDPTTPEPLPPEHPLWAAPNCLLSMHLAGRSQGSLLSRAADLLLENLEAYVAGRPMRNLVDLRAGY